jgi:hypothetical protein
VVVKFHRNSATLRSSYVWPLRTRAGIHLAPEEVRRTVREEVRRDLGDMGGAIEVEVEIRFGSGRR